MLQDTVQQGCCEDRISHHLRPVSDLLVGSKNQGGGFVGIADKGKEPVSLSPGDRGIPYFIHNNELGLLQVLDPEPGSSVHFSVIQQLNQVHHLLEADGVAAINGLQAEATGNHGFPKSRRTGKDEVSAVVQPVEFFQPGKLRRSNAGFQFVGIKQLQRLHIRREMGS